MLTQILPVIIHDLAPCITKQQRGKVKNNTSKDRPAGKENLPTDMRFRCLGRWTFKMVNVWTRSFWWVYINTKTPKVLGNALVNMLALQRRFVGFLIYSLFRFWLLWLSVRSTSLFVLPGKQARMGTCKVRSAVRLTVRIHIQMLLWSYFWRRSWLANLS